VAHARDIAAMTNSSQTVCASDGTRPVFRGKQFKYCQYYQRVLNSGKDFAKSLQIVVLIDATEALLIRQQLRRADD
jgi:hypothetical protein